MRRYTRSILYIADILEWAKDFYREHRRWPTDKDGLIAGNNFTWNSVNAALNRGYRGLRGRSTLAKLFLKKFGRRHLQFLPAFTVDQILAWADAHFKRTKDWPSHEDGKIPGVPGETWSSVNYALVAGTRGLPEGGSLACLLAEHRGVRNEKDLPDFKIKTILAWADAHHDRTGQWPTTKSGPVAEAPGETWHAVHAALHNGRRGLPPGDSLPRLLARHRGVKNRKALPKLSISKIVALAKEFKRRHGRWPTMQRDKQIPGHDLTWVAIDAALKTGLRGLRGGSSLAKLLMERCGHRHAHLVPKLTIKQILAWVDAHHKRTEKWPCHHDGAIPGAPGETWSAVNAALSVGSRGLPGGSSLARLLSERRGKRNHLDLSPLSVEQILAWADAHYAKTGTWPKRRSGNVESAPGETWDKIDNSLNLGHRGMPKGGSLPRLLAEHRGVRNRHELPKLDERNILTWADAYFERTGKWPNSKSGAIAEAPGENWGAIAAALVVGVRGFPGGDSLYRLLQRNGRTSGSLRPVGQ